MSSTASMKFPLLGEQEGRPCAVLGCPDLAFRESRMGRFPKRCPPHREEFRVVRPKGDPRNKGDYRRGLCRCGCGRTTISPRPGLPPRSYIGGHSPSSKDCKADGCDRKSYRGGYCNAHKLRVDRYGDPLVHRPVTVRQNRYISSDGYVVLAGFAEHPNAHRNGSLLEHVKVMSETLGRPLARGETVHHRNGVRADNRPENLELWSGNHPKGARVSDQVRWALEIISTYGDDPTKW